jgi:hypothetical protein
MRIAAHYRFAGPHERFLTHLDLTNDNDYENQLAGLSRRSGGNEMKRITTTLMVGAILLFGAVTMPARGDDQQIDRRHVRTVEVQNVTPRGGKNVALQIAINPPPGIKLPTNISALVNDRQIDLYDDGRWPDERGGDGVYCVGGATKDGQPLSDKATLRVQSSGMFEPHAVAPKFSCSIFIVECPKDCKSALTQSRCVICVKVTDCGLSF